MQLPVQLRCQQGGGRVWASPADFHTVTLLIASLLVRAGAFGEKDTEKGPAAAVQRLACIGS